MILGHEFSILDAVKGIAKELQAVHYILKTYIRAGRTIPDSYMEELIDATGLRNWQPEPMPSADAERIHENEELRQVYEEQGPEAALKWVARLNETKRQDVAREGNKP